MLFILLLLITPSWGHKYTTYNNSQIYCNTSSITDPYCKLYLLNIKFIQCLHFARNQYRCVSYVNNEKYIEYDNQMYQRDINKDIINLFNLKATYNIMKTDNEEYVNVIFVPDKNKIFNIF